MNPRRHVNPVKSSCLKDPNERERVMTTTFTGYFASLVSENEAKDLTKVILSKIQRYTELSIVCF